MNRHARRAANKAAGKDQPDVLTDVPPNLWPPHPAGLRRVWRSKKFLVQLYADAGGGIRLSISRAKIGTLGRWAGEITWDELQMVKREVGLGDAWAVEIYPPDADLVNDANMRHLWLLEGRPPFAWTKDNRHEVATEAKARGTF